MTDSKKVGDEGLERVIGTRALGLNIVNLVVGAGIFVLPGIVAAELGSAAILAYLVCSIAVALVFLCFAEIGSRVTRSGGAYAYIEEAFGPFAGFIAAMLFWFGWSALADAAITVAMVETIAIGFPVLLNPFARALFIIGLFTFLVVVNVLGVESGVRLYVFNTMAKLVPLLLLVMVGLFSMNYEYLVISEWPAISSIGAGAIALFFAFGGAESGLSASGEIKNPSKTVPRGLLVGLTGILALYVGLQTVAQGVLGPELANNQEAPLAAAAREVFGEWGAKMLLIGGAISIFSTLSGDFLAAPRVTFAAARDGNLPKVLARVHPKYNTPYVSIIFFAAVICIIALSGTFRPLAVLASGSILLIYAGVSLAVIRLRRRDGEPAAGEFKLPGGPTIPVLSCLFVGWLLSQIQTDEALGLGLLVGASILIYGMRSYVRRSSA